MHNKILEIIESYDSIVLYRHVLPDMDAIGSQYGLAYWIHERYPEKKIVCAGNLSGLHQRLNLFDFNGEYDPMSSLAIVLDSSNLARIDDYQKCSFSVRIDHHVKIETICDEEWIDEKASATCEMLALWIKKFGDCSKRVSQLLYLGLSADNISFKTSNVRPQSFEAGEYLVSQNADVVEASTINFSSSWSDFQYETCIRQHAILSDHFLYSIMDADKYEKFEQTFSQAKEKVYTLSSIDEVTIWALFTQMEDKLHYSASLRSRNIPIREVAQRFGGGGHACASGIKNLTREQIDEILSTLSELS